ncbi:hypothetical protein N752_09535 [Desulforamulus aquiferis]|nr:hypothetical protein N752_09535 [Desulforamulus aquiferis]
MFGGLKGVFYNDAFQGSIMFIGMIVLLVVTYSKLGGVTTAHQALSDLTALVPEGLAAQGHVAGPQCLPWARNSGGW